MRAARQSLGAVRSLLTQPAERGRYFLSSPSFTRKHQIRFINKPFSENDSKPMVQRGGQSVHNPVVQPCKRSEDGSLHCPWIPRQSRSTPKKRSPRLSHLHEIVVSPLRATWDFLLIGGGGEAGNCPKARVASPVNQFSATSCRARRGAQIAVLQSGSFVTVELWQRRCGSCWTSAARGITTSSAQIREEIDAVCFFFLILLQTYGSYDK